MLRPIKFHCVGAWIATGSLVHTYAVDHMYRPTHLRRTAVGLRNVSENFGAEILNNLNSLAKNLLIERLHVHLTPTKFKQLLAEKS
jgi:hypothetical protein